MHDTELKATDEKLEVTIFIFNHRCPWIPPRTCNDQRPQFMEVSGRYGLGECKLAGENWGYADFIGFNVDVGGDNRASGVIDTLALVKRSEEQSVRAKQSLGTVPSCVSGKDPLSSLDLA